MPRRREPDPFLSALGANIRKVRKDAGMSLDKLSARIGICKGTLSSIEHGRVNVTVATCKRMADGLGVHVAALFPPSGLAQ